MIKSLFEKNAKAPEETIIGLSKGYGYFQIFGGICYLIICLFLLFYSESKVYKSIFFFILLYFCFAFYSMMKNSKIDSKIKLKINNKGIQIEKRFISWSKIENFDFISRPNYSSVSSSDYLVIYTINGKEEVFLNELNISAQKLNYLLKMYQRRSLK